MRDVGKVVSIIFFVGILIGCKQQTDTNPVPVPNPAPTPTSTPIPTPTATITPSLPNLKIHTSKLAGLHYWFGWRYRNTVYSGFENYDSLSHVDTFSITVLNDSTIIDGRSNIVAYYQGIWLWPRNDSEFYFSKSVNRSDKYHTVPSYSLIIRYNYFSGVIYYRFSNDTGVLHGVVELQSQ